MSDEKGEMCSQEEWFEDQATVLKLWEPPAPDCSRVNSRWMQAIVELPGQGRSKAVENKTPVTKKAPQETFLENASKIKCKFYHKFEGGKYYTRMGYSWKSIADEELIRGAPKIIFSNDRNFKP